MASRLVAGLLLALIGGACAGYRSPSATTVVDPRGVDELSWIEEKALAATNACVGPIEEDDPRFIVVFQGLLDFASENPYATGPSVEQEDLPVALVNATEPFDLPVRNSRKIVVHTPVLHYRGELEPGGSRRWDTKELEHLEVVVGEAEDPQPVSMHQERLQGRVPNQGAQNDACSLKWTILIDDLVERKRLRDRVFVDPDERLVISHILVKRGEAFTVDVFRPGYGTPCIVDFPWTTFGLGRAVASMFAVAIPAVDNALTLHVTDLDGKETTWTFTLPAHGPREAVLVIRNHATATSEGYDFAGHLALRERMNEASTVVKLPLSPECDSLGFDSLSFDNDNPQCSPANNRWP